MDMLVSSASATADAQQELAKWQADRAYWAETLPVMEMLSNFLILTPVLHQQIATASTDGRHLYFCPRYSASLSDESRRFLHAHLIWHCVAGHLTAPLVADRHRWHLACDHEVNALLLALGIPLPLNSLLFPVCVGRSAIDVYRWLEGHPDTSLEVATDIHPAALWWHLPNATPDQRMVSLWLSAPSAFDRPGDRRPARESR
ncbi:MULTISPECIES: hypothetical protein [unclassified Halomonas]|uniref:DUF2201 family putative metallopeptidase n=1 Tax=unclassified Halomonas TaxID=2609666 RepID=UPI000A72EC6F|nr:MULTISPECIES: hypothetical protein [unclassified Halomonas]